MELVEEGILKREIEALITAAQDQAIRTYYIKANIDKSQRDAKCKNWFRKNARKDMITWRG